MRYHLAYIGWLAKTRNYLAGDNLTYADLAAAAHISAIDYLEDVPWIEDDAAKAWYARVKIQALVPPAAERMAGRRAGLAHLCGPEFLRIAGIARSTVPRIQWQRSGDEQTLACSAQPLNVDVRAAAKQSMSQRKRKKWDCFAASRQ